jgi:hypothetical protein
MRLSSFKRLYKGDFKQEFQALVDQLATSINIGIEALYDALNRKLTLRDNIACTVKEIDVKVDAAGTPTTTTLFKMDISNRLEGITVLSALNTDDSTGYPTGGIFISWTQTQNGILINNITGLIANQTYRLKIVAFGV